MNLTRQLLELDTIALQAHARDWRDAVRIGTDLLVGAGTVEARYYDAIVKMTGELGAWYLLAPGIAMPHARPEEGVKQTSFALVTLAEPVSFGDPDNDPIDLLITLAAADAKTMNEEAIVEVVTLLDNEDTVRRIRAAKTRDGIRALFAEL
jgi:PTS system ascorbate-specific IIA component